MGLFTMYVQDKSKPEASMATSYNVDEALGFCTKYFKLYPHSKRRLWNDEEELRDSSELPEGMCKKLTLLRQEIDQIHEYVVLL